MATESKRLQRCRLNKHRHRAKRGEVFRATATRHGTRVILLGGEKGLSLITPDERGVTAPPPLGLRARHTKEQGTSTSASAARYGLLMRHIRKLQESHSTKRRKSLNNGGADGTRTRELSFEINNLLYCNDPDSPSDPYHPHFLHQILHQLDRKAA